MVTRVLAATAVSVVVSNLIRKRAKRAILVSQKTRNAARLRMRTKKTPSPPALQHHSKLHPICIPIVY